MFDKLSEVGLKVNGEKCEFRLSKLTFFGHVLTRNGNNPSEETVSAIRDARPPKDASQVRSFMDLVQYSAKFMADVASMAKPIQELTRKEIIFKTGEDLFRSWLRHWATSGLIVGQESLQMRLQWV